MFFWHVMPSPLGPQLSTSSVHCQCFLPFSCCVTHTCVSSHAHSLTHSLTLTHTHTHSHSLTVLDTVLHTFLRQGSCGFWGDFIVAVLLMVPVKHEMFLFAWHTHILYAVSGLSLRTYTDSKKQVVDVGSTRPASHVRSSTELHTHTLTYVFIVVLLSLSWWSFECLSWNQITV